MLSLCYTLSLLSQPGTLKYICFTPYGFWFIYFRTVFDEGIDDIPSAGAPLDKFLCCDVCMRKDDKRRLAQIYCVVCQKKFCTPHEKVQIIFKI